MCMSVLAVCISVFVGGRLFTYVWSALCIYLVSKEGEKRELILWKLELQIVVSCHVCAGN